jgi:hypothetical protein
MKPSRLVIGYLIFIVGAMTGDALSANPLLTQIVAIALSVVVAVVFIVAVLTQTDRSL